MVINRDMRQAQVYTIGENDEYGQPTLNPENPITIQLTFGLYNHSPVEDPRYQDVMYTGLTHYNLTDKNVVQIGDAQFKVKFVNPYGRLNQVFLTDF